MKKIFFAFAIIFAFLYTGFAFDWPQDEIASSDFFSYFGQLRGGVISSSLVFAKPSSVKAAESGEVIGIILENDDFFPSALGNAVIAAHDNNLVCVYGNLDAETIPQKIFTETKIATGDELGFTGNAGWQDGKSSLEFQTLDSKTGNAVNPRILLPRLGKELPLSVGTVTLKTNSLFYKLSATRNIPRGTYRIYRARQKIAMPYKTRLTVNGAVIDAISYDRIFHEGFETFAAGTKAYSKTALYPDENLQLIGEATLTSGRNTVGIVLSDILENETSAVYNISCY